MGVTRRIFGDDLPLRIHIHCLAMETCKFDIFVQLLQVMAALADQLSAPCPSLETAPVSPCRKN